jgi:hypothetical protein
LLGFRGTSRNNAEDIRSSPADDPYRGYATHNQRHLTFARLLRIPYLWVDALCIIQDSDQDWAEQSAQIANIYSNALVTLAALDAASTTDSFLVSRNIEPTRPQIEIQVQSHHSGKACKKTERAFLRKQYPYHAWFNRSSHLHSRVWCLQECLLSERTIYFQYDQMFWQCTEAWFREGNAKPGNEGAHDVASTLTMRAEHRDWRDYVLKERAASLQMWQKRLRYPAKIHMSSNVTW